MLMAKRILASIVVVGIFCVGCGAEKDDGVDSAEQVFYYLSKGDFERALDYCKDGSDAYNTLNEKTQKNIVASFNNDFAEEKELVEYFETDRNFISLFQTYKDYMFDGYEIYDSQEETDEKIIVNIRAERIDDKKSYIYTIDIELMMAEYTYVNYEQLNKIYEEKGEAAMVVEILENISTKYCQIAKDALIKNASYVECNYAVSVEKISDEWLVTEIVRIDE